MAKRTSVNISSDVLIELQTIARSGKAERRLVERSKIILQWYEGKSFAETRALLGVSDVAINKWRKRFVEKSMGGLKDAPRTGKPSTLTAV